MLDRTIPPEIHTIENVELSPVTVERLPNGLTVNVIDQDEFNDISRVTLVVDGGKADCQDPAVASLSIEMLPEGTSRFDGAEIADRLESAGAWRKGGAADFSRFMTVYTLNSQFGKTLPLLYEMFNDPSFPEKNFEKLKIRSEKSLELSLSRCDVRAARRMKELVLAPGNPTRVLSTPESVREIGLESVRQFHSTHFDPKRMSIYAAGRVTDGMMESISDFFGRIPSVENETPGTYCDRRSLRLNDRLSTDVREHVEVAGAQQNSVLIDIPVTDIVPSSDEYILLRYAVCALGGYFGSRLMSDIREEKGLTYGINAYMNVAGDAHSLVTIASECRSENTDDLISAVEEQIRRLAENPPEGDELDRLRKFLQSQLNEVVSTPFNQVIHHLNTRLSGCASPDFGRMFDLTREMTGRDIADVAVRYLFRHKFIVTAGRQ